MRSLIIPIIYDVYTIAYVYIHIYEKLNISMGTIFPPFPLSTPSIYPYTPRAELRSLSANSGSAWKVEADEGAWRGRIHHSRTDEAAQSPPM